MSNNNIYDGRNRCDRCNRPISNPTANYGPWCAQLLDVNPYTQIASTLNSEDAEDYNVNIKEALSPIIRETAIKLAASQSEYIPATNIPNGILKIDYDRYGNEYDWDAARFGNDSPEYKMLTGLNTAYMNANIHGHWKGDRERIVDLANTLRCTDTRITGAIVLNNSKGATKNGHTAVLLINPHGQGFYFSYSAANGYFNDIGEMRFSVLSADEVNEIKDRSGEVYESVTIYGDRRWDEEMEDDPNAYDRFVWCDVPNIEAGNRMFKYAAEIFSNPGHYNAVMWKDGLQCDYMVQQILAAGGIEYEKKLRPNDSFELFRNGKVTWINETGVKRGDD